MTLITSPVFIPEAQLKKAGSFAALFGNDNPLCLEIGCGIGDFVVQIAELHPERNYIAIDIFNQGCRQTCSRIEESGLRNIRMMRIEARYLLHHYLGKDSLQAIYINCPDPWPKKRHRKRRLLNKDFLNLVLYCLQPGGVFNFSTDFVDYGESAGELLAADCRFINRHCTPYTHELGDYPISKYMRRFLDLGQPIYFCSYSKREGLQIEPPKLQKGFRLRWPKEEV
ncbi:tRNA (guanosine(46)-N7)-methyltransferase TrmB [Malonomonas rubra]|uniref:tRNA (guanosine(46)-N7)-methyltransferase TrmB n=1 Tax=Malonomonas rubra TaxID=57040 RepID=UPI0026EDECCB|nr:tRNA (guanosine(46)-N7)-methyltransferase TrmB [Malonomonas rubra]